MGQKDPNLMLAIYMLQINSIPFTFRSITDQKSPDLNSHFTHLRTFSRTNRTNYRHYYSKSLYLILYIYIGFINESEIFDILLQ